MKKVLVVDDEEHIVLYMSTLLEDHGLQPVSTMDSRTALETARRERPDLICLDIMMPRKSGLSLYEAIRKDALLRDVPVIVISGMGRLSRGFREEFRKHLPDLSVPEPDAFFEKPLKPGPFLSLLDRLLCAREPE